ERAFHLGEAPAGGKRAGFKLKRLCKCRGRIVELEIHPAREAERLICGGRICVELDRSLGDALCLGAVFDTEIKISDTQQLADARVSLALKDLCDVESLAAGAAKVEVWRDARQRVGPQLVRNRLWRVGRRGGVKVG